MAFPWHASLIVSLTVSRGAVQLGLSELRGIPMAVLDRLEKVPAEYLTTLAESKDLFDELSPKVQRQVSSQGVYTVDRGILWCMSPMQRHVSG